jgi:DNA-binding NtrC family response regulator
MEDHNGVMDNGMIWELPYKKALAMSSKRFAKDYIMAVLKKHKGNVTRAALHAGINRESLHRLMRKYEIHSADFKE